MSVELPKDAEGREIPLDTKTLYDENGKRFKVNRFTYSVVQTMPGLKWGVVFMDCLYDYCNSFYLAPPEPPDSWEKLEEDIRRIGTDDCTWFCGYANENPVENACPDSCKFFKGDEITCRKKLADDILSRIRKLRGEGDA